VYDEALTPPPLSTPARSDEGRPALRRELRLWHVVFFNLSSVLGIRWLAAAAHVGPGSLTLWLLASLTFFLPSALVVSSLAARFPEEGGLYVWTKNAFGDWHGFLCSWLYFMSNVLFFPLLLISTVSMASYMFGQNGIRYSENATYAIPVTFAALWLGFLVNLTGLRVGKWAGIFGAGSTYLLALILIGFAFLVARRFGSATQFHFMPAATWDNFNFWSQIALAMTGLELAPILGGEIQNTSNVIPRAAWISGLGCAAFYIAGTAAMLILQSPERINPMTGLAQAGDLMGARVQASWLSPCFSLLITVGGVGQLSTFIAGNSRLPFALGLDHYLPAGFAKLHPRWRTPYVSILSQAALASALLLLTQTGETLRSAYQILVDMTVISSFIPFIYIFSAGFKFGQRWAGAIGAVVAAMAVVLSAIPPAGVASVALFELKVVGGTACLALLGRWIFARSEGLAA